MLRSKHLALGAVPAVLALLDAAPASATVLTSSATLSSCVNSYGQTVNGCTDTVYYSDQVASDTTPFLGGTVAGQDPINADFVTAFNNWNAANGSVWTLVNGGMLNLDLTLSIGPAINTSSNGSSYSAGITPVVINISNYTQGANDPGLSQLVWTQALFTDYTPTGGLNNFTPTVTLDTYSLSKGSSSSDGSFTSACTPIPGPPNAANNTTPSTIGATPSGTAYCDPIYPFQYASSHNSGQANGVPLSTDFFYDGPEGPWAFGAFRGEVLLSTVTYDTNSAGAITGNVLTVYQGADYGFSLSSTPGVGTSAVPGVATVELVDVPEPAGVATLVLGLVASVLVRTRLRRRGE